MSKQPNLRNAGFQNVGSDLTIGGVDAAQAAAIKKQPIMRSVQRWHLWLGTLFAPSILFFALTGALQTFNLHEGLHTPAIIAQMASVHKNQKLMSQHRAGPPAEHARGPKPGGEQASGLSPLPLKIYVLLMSVGLIATTLLGIWMAFKYSRSKAVVWGLLIAGTLLPVALLFM